MAPVRRALAGLLVVATAAMAQPPAEFRLVGPTDETERITGIYCESVDACVVTAEAGFGEGHLYATDGHDVTATLLTSDSALGEVFGLIGAPDLMGFTKVGDTLYVNVAGAAGALLRAEGDVTSADSWTSSTLGAPDGRDTFGGNQQVGLGTDGSVWLLFTRGMIYTADDGPAPGTVWYETWAPTPPGEVPGDIGQRARTDPTLYIASPSFGVSPALTQMAYVAPDLSLVIYPAGARNQMGTAEPGICVSTDGGQLFHHVRFPDVEGDLGPLGVTCLGDVCLAYGGLENEPTSTYIYVTHDASAGAGATWTRAQLPRLREDARFRAAALTADGQVAWVVGAVGSAAPLALMTEDGGVTWTDVSGLVRAQAPETRLHSVHLFDESHVWIGGENGLLLSGGY